MDAQIQKMVSTFQYLASMDVMATTFSGRLEARDLVEAIEMATTNAAQHDCHDFLMDFSAVDLTLNISMAFELVAELPSLGMRPSHKFAIVSHCDGNSEAFKTFELVFHNRHTQGLRRFDDQDQALAWLKGTAKDDLFGDPDF